MTKPYYYSPFRFAAVILILVFWIAGMAAHILIFPEGDGAIGGVLGAAVGGLVGFCIERYGRKWWK